MLNYLSFSSCEQIKYLIKYFLLFLHVSHVHWFLQALDCIIDIVITNVITVNEMIKIISQLIIVIIMMLQVSSYIQAMMDYQQDHLFGLIITLLQWLV